MTSNLDQAMPNEMVKQQRMLLKEMDAREDDPRVLALDRIDARQQFVCDSCDSHERLSKG